MFRTFKIQIKKGHRMYDYFQNISILTNNLFNTINYYYRQIISGFENDFNNENQIEVLNNINEYLT